VATLRPAPARAPAPIRGGYARHRGYTRLGHESAGDRVSTDVCERRSRLSVRSMAYGWSSTRIDIVRNAHVAILVGALVVC